MLIDCSNVNCAIENGMLYREHVDGTVVLTLQNGETKDYYLQFELQHGEDKNFDRLLADVIEALKLDSKEEREFECAKMSVESIIWSKIKSAIRGRDKLEFTSILEIIYND